MRYDHKLKDLVIQTRQDVVTLSNALIATQESFIKVMHSTNDISSVVIHCLDTIKIVEADLLTLDTKGVATNTSKIRRIEGS